MIVDIRRLAAELGRSIESLIRTRQEQRPTERHDAVSPP
jgi:hypothetical protein